MNYRELLEISKKYPNCCSIDQSYAKTLNRCTSKWRDELEKELKKKNILTD